MKRVKLSIVTLIVTTNFMMAGGDIIPVTPYEEEDIKAAEVVPVTIPKEPVVAPIVTPVADVSPFYVGVGLVAGRYDSRCLNGPVGCDGTDTSGGIMGRVGYDFNQYIGIETRAMITPISSDGAEIKHIGGFIKPMYPITNALNTYGLVGVAKTTTSGTLRRSSVEGLAFGAGVEYDLSDDKKKDAKYDREFDGEADQEKGFGVFADYERLYYKSGSPDLDAVSIGVTYDF